MLSKAYANPKVAAATAYFIFARIGAGNEEREKRVDKT